MFRVNFNNKDLMPIDKNMHQTTSSPKLPELFLFFIAGNTFGGRGVKRVVPKLK